MRLLSVETNFQFRENSFGIQYLDRFLTDT